MFRKTWIVDTIYGFGFFYTITNVIAFAFYTIFAILYAVDIWNGAVRCDGREVVFDSDGNLVTNYIDKGTYNYGEQSILPGSVHDVYDKGSWDKQMKQEGYKTRYNFDFPFLLDGNSKLWDKKVDLNKGVGYK